VTSLLKDIKIESENKREKAITSELPTPTSDPSKYRIQFLPSKPTISSSETLMPPIVRLSVNERMRGLYEYGGVCVGEAVAVGVRVCVGVNVGVRVGVGVTVGVTVGVNVGVDVAVGTMVSSYS
jgi:hypothetical protein